MCISCYHHFHPLLKNAIVGQGVNENCNLNFFEMTTNINEPMKELVNRELLIFKRFQVDPKDIKCPLNGGKSMNLCFL
jgi:hypothetical protein